MPSPLRILLLSAYDAASHRRWHLRLVEQFPEIEWTVLTLPPRHFSWRFRGNPLSWAYGQPELWQGSWDLLVVTSMVDLSTLRGICPNLAQVPALLYVHENQFAYPVEQAEVKRDVFHHCMLNLYAALSAHRVVFNSSYNQESFLSGARALLKKMPDRVPAGVVERLAQRSSVLPVPLEPACFQTPSEKSGPLTLVWNHRWEYDKAPGTFFDALRLLKRDSVPFRLRMVGQRFSKVPRVFKEARVDLEEHLEEWGFVESKEEYFRILSSSDVVVSTALHEFQGLAVLEAVASGCVPLLPNRLAYAALFDEEWLYPSTPQDPSKESAVLAERLKGFALNPDRLRLRTPPDVTSFSWTSRKQEYRRLLEETARLSSSALSPWPSSS